MGEAYGEGGNVLYGTRKTLRRDFGDQVALLVDGVTKLDKVKFGEAAQAETVRKMVVAMAKDPRVLVIKLADRLHNMRTMRYLKREKQEKKARETLEIYAPLAHRLGMNTIKWELEDLAFAILYPKMYDEIVRLVAERAPKRDEYLAIVTDEVQADLRAARIKATVTGRPKHYYSVYQKMIVRGRDFAEIYDLVGIRVLVDTVRDCYAALGTVHARWNPVPGRFKDYIAMPKFNMYQSLHTTVIGPSGKPVELQIRTFDMHRRAEYGIAAHWKYKQEAVAGASKIRTDVPKNAGKNQDTVNDMAWLRQLLDWQKETEDPGEFLESLRFDLSRNEVFVFTPKGDVIALPAGATPVDFAYAVAHRGRPPHHRGPGQRTAGAARIDPGQRRLGGGLHLQGTRAPAPPETGSASSSPPAPATRSGPGSPRSAGTRRSEQGKDSIARAMRKQNLPIQRILTGDSLVTLAHEMRYPDISSLYAAIGEGHVAAQGVVQKLVQALGGEDAATEDIEEAAPIRGRSKRRSSAIRAWSSRASTTSGSNWPAAVRPFPATPSSASSPRGTAVSTSTADCVTKTVSTQRSPAAVGELMRSSSGAWCAHPVVVLHIVAIRWRRSTARGSCRTSLVSCRTSTSTSSLACRADLPRPVGDLARSPSRWATPSTSATSSRPSAGGGHLRRLPRDLGPQAVARHTKGPPAIIAGGPSRARAVSSSAAELLQALQRLVGRAAACSAPWPAWSALAGVARRRALAIWSWSLSTASWSCGQAGRTGPRLRVGPPPLGLLGLWMARSTACIRPSIFGRASRGTWPMASQRSLTERNAARAALRSVTGRSFSRHPTTSSSFSVRLPCCSASRSREHLAARLEEDVLRAAEAGPQLVLRLALGAARGRPLGHQVPVPRAVAPQSVDPGQALRLGDQLLLDLAGVLALRVQRREVRLAPLGERRAGVREAVPQLVVRLAVQPGQAPSRCRPGPAAARRPSATARWPPAPRPPRRAPPWPYGPPRTASPWPPCAPRGAPRPWRPACPDAPRAPPDRPPRGARPPASAGARRRSSRPWPTGPWS
ncbi:hypothetical protein GCM10020221_12540 [Streptomyces thioluteus]|uniref:RelA/SpoT domain-containing protein n=1 Tax=Streptomyces thioluteus TaxID=66431 RepID=A0ABP6J212_STRTU